MRKNIFRYWYSNGKDKFSKEFTLDQIINGNPFDEISDSPLMGDYKMLDIVDEYIGWEDKKKVKIFEGDEILATIKRHNIETIGYIEYTGLTCAWGNRNEGGLTLLSELIRIEIIGNIQD